MSKRRVAVLAMAVASTAVAAATPAQVTAAPHAVPLQVASVALQGDQTAVTSSTGHKLQLQLDAHTIPGANSGDDVTVSLSSGTTAKSEIHNWNFPVDSNVFVVDDTGTGTLNVPADEIAPYGTVTLNVAPVGSPTTQKCNGNPISQTQQVTLTGTFNFVTHSSGVHAWGSVSKSSLTAEIVSTYATGLGAACFDFDSLPCLAGVFWEANQGSDLSFDGVTAGTKGSLVASRTKTLTEPSGATRNDEAFATTNKLTIHKTSSSATLAVTALGNSSGSATLKAGKAQPADSVNCKDGKKKKVETTTSWGNAKYKNGKKPLTVLEQIFGSIKIANGTQAQLSLTKLT